MEVDQRGTLAPISQVPTASHLLLLSCGERSSDVRQMLLEAYVVSACMLCIGFYLLCSVPFIASCQVSVAFICGCCASLSGFVETGLLCWHHCVQISAVDSLSSYILLFAHRKIFSIVLRGAVITMTGKFTAKDPRRCAHYARFFKHLTLPQANAIFWLLFILVSHTVLID